MPAFLTEFMNELHAERKRLKAEPDADDFSACIEHFWLPFHFHEDFCGDEVLAVDSSSAKHSLGDGSIFYVVRALALSANRKYKRVSVGHEYSPNFKDLPLLGRLREHLEHLVALDALKDGFEGFILIDGSLFGRLSHLPKETDFVKNRALMVDYFEVLSSFLDAARRSSVPVVGVSKESRTSFFRTFLLAKILENAGVEQEFRHFLIRSAVEGGSSAVFALKRAEEELDEGVKRLFRAFLLQRRPDFHLILKYARSKNETGCTTPLLLGTKPRFRRELEAMRKDPVGFLRRRFPISALDDGFLERARGVVESLERLPAIVSFHVLPALNDTPMRIDVPAWFFGINKTLSDVRFPEDLVVCENYEKLEEILRLISAGYCGLENYNIWLSAVDSAVKLRKDVFEAVYLRKFEEIMGIEATARGERRVKFP